MTMAKNGKLSVWLIGRGKWSLNRFCLTLVTAIVFFFGVEAIDIRCYHGGRMETIDDTKQICCNGIYNKLDKRGFQQDCCDVNVYDNKVEQTVFSTNEKICCSGKLIDLPQSRHFNASTPTCCGQDYFYSDEHICCNDKTYNKGEKSCYKDACGEVVYGHDDILCRNNTAKGSCVVIHRRQHNHKCCGPNLIDRATHTCIRNQPWPKHIPAGTCGGQVYDESKNICCEGHGKDTYTLMPKPQLNQTNVRYLGTSSDYSCLGSQIINNDLEHIAESGNRKQVVPNHFLPCGDTYYDPHNKRTQVACCEGVVNHARPDMNVMCCGNEFIDLNVHECCDNKKIDSSMLCCGGNQKYSRKSGLECCGSQLINNSYLCCKLQSSMYMPVRKQPGHNTCCGQKTFNFHSNKICCAGQIIEVQQNQTCISGHIVTVDSTNPKDVRERMREVSKSHLRIAQQRNACPSCQTYMNPPKKCVKRFESALYIRNTAVAGNNTYLDILFLEPSILRGTKMVFQTKGHCRCYQRDELYMFQTNRDILAKLKAGINKLRFSKRDIFSIIKGEFSKYKVEGVRCKIDRYFRKPPVS